ncbi:HipA domain-containing protein [Clostridium beijerinckii]|uniref:HipA-like C-terminal domain-containing protein n=2 Tax=Clostridium beijerinckii TaxID=1520 RepID=A0A7X9SRJ7_CLOBE|nr:hypothetical protein [Clostridium beijerinckii]
MYIDFNDWDTYDGFSEGSGTSSQQWIVNKSGDKIGLFKFPKSPETTDHISEAIASDIARIIGINCADIDLGIYRDQYDENKIKKGMISYKINDEGEDLIEGISVISSKYKNYDSQELKDTVTGECYSLDMIMNSLNQYGLEKEFLKIVIFDFLIGNSDRHDRNWAVLRKDRDVILSPVYDNASSLCAYENESTLERCLGKDQNKFKALVDSKSRTLIRIDKFELGKKGPRHSEMIEYIKNNHYSNTIEFVESIKCTLTEEIIDMVLDNYSEYLSVNKCKVIKKYLKEKVRILLNIYSI